MKFYLGTDNPAQAEQVRIPWMISITRIGNRKRPLDCLDWLMDSGGFNMIANHGRFTVSENEYLESIDRHGPRLAFCQDWMCEPFIIEKTGLTVRDHQERTLESYLSLSAKEARIAPVLQGWRPSEYVRHIEMYRTAGVDMSQVFGLGTVCSRNKDIEAIGWILANIERAAPEIKLHGFGVKTTALSAYHHKFASADSMAWSARGRRDFRFCEGCERNSCAHCLDYALLWRCKVLDGLSDEQQMTLAA